MGGRVLATVAVAAIAVAGCGDEDFENKTRAPVAIGLSGVIQKNEVIVSPTKGLGAGPFEITIANQTGDTHTVTLEGESVRERAGSVAPSDTITITRSLEPGTYEVKAGSEQAVSKEIKPAVLKVGAERRDSNSDLLLP
jgi:hypothetical protein